VIPIAVGQQMAGLLVLEDQLRPEAKQTIARLHALGIRTVLISGDNRATAERIASVGRTYSFSSAHIKGELDEWQQRDTSLRVQYVVSSTEGRLTQEKLRGYLARFDSTEANYYLIGPGGMVTSYERMLAGLHIDKDRIRTDSFTCYE